MFSDLARYSYSVYISYIMSCFNVGYLCVFCVCVCVCVCVLVLFAMQHCKIYIALWYIVRGDFTLNLLTVSIVIISLYTVLLTCFKD